MSSNSDDQPPPSSSSPFRPNSNPDSSSASSSSSSIKPPQVNSEKIDYPPADTIRGFVCRSIRFGSLRTEPAQKDQSCFLTQTGVYFFIKQLDHVGDYRQQSSSSSIDKRQNHHSSTSSTGNESLKLSRPPIHNKSSPQESSSTASDTAFKWMAKRGVEAECVNLSLGWRHIRRLYYSFNTRLLVMFVETTSAASGLLRKTFGLASSASSGEEMDMRQQPYFEAESMFDHHKYITILLGVSSGQSSTSEEAKMLSCLRDLSKTEMMRKVELIELTPQDANSMLMRTIPPMLKSPQLSTMPTSPPIAGISVSTTRSTTNGGAYAIGAALSMIQSENTVSNSTPPYSRASVASTLSSTNNAANSTTTKHKSTLTSNVVSNSNSPISFLRGMRTRTTTVGNVRISQIPINTPKLVLVPRIVTSSSNNNAKMGSIFSSGTSGTTIQHHQRTTRSSTAALLTKPITLIQQHQEEPRVLFSYKPLAGGEIDVYDRDLACLDDGEFLNDTIIDFYLDYLLRQLPEEQRRRVHLFSTLFWTAYTSCPYEEQKPSGGNGLTAAANRIRRQHARASRWTKRVDLFEKDFIMIPINESAHWFLAIVSYPSLDAPIYADPSSVPPVLDEEEKNEANVGLDEEEVKEETTMDAMEVEEGEETKEPSTIITNAADEPIITASALGLDSECSSASSTPDPSAPLIVDDDPPIAAAIPAPTNSQQQQLSDSSINNSTSTIVITDSAPMSQEEPTEPNSSLPTTETLSSSNDDDTPSPKEKPIKQQEPAADMNENAAYSVYDDRYDFNVDFPPDDDDQQQPTAKKARLTKPPPAPRLSPPKSAASTSTKSKPPKRRILKQHGIYVLDSLKDGSSHNKTTRMIREYLNAEWTSRKPHMPVRKFQPDTWRGAYMVVPQQTNYSDCGIFLLEYAERFLFNGPCVEKTETTKKETEENDDEDDNEEDAEMKSMIPGTSATESTATTKKTVGGVGDDFWATALVNGRQMRGWFPVEHVGRKRRELRELIMKLADEYKSKGGENNTTDGGEVKEEGDVSSIGGGNGECTDGSPKNDDIILVHTAQKRSKYHLR